MRIVYRGPGDSVQVDGVEFKKGETADVTGEQVRRIRASDPEAVVEVTNEKADDEAAQAAQDRQRTRAAKAAEKES